MGRVSLWRAPFVPPNPAPYPQAVSSSPIGHLSCGPRNCGPQSGSRRLCSSPRTCYMLGACKAKVSRPLSLSCSPPPPAHAILSPKTQPSWYSILRDFRSLFLPPGSSAILLPGCLTWVSCTGASCGSRPPLPSGAAWTKVCATPPSWTCKDVPSAEWDSLSCLLRSWQ